MTYTAAKITVSRDHMTLDGSKQQDIDLMRLYPLKYAI